MQFSTAENNTILAALRYFQANYTEASSFFNWSLLNNDQIDEFCERLNDADEPVVIRCPECNEETSNYAHGSVPNAICNSCGHEWDDPAVDDLRL